MAALADKFHGITVLNPPFQILPASKCSGISQAGEMAALGIASVCFYIYVLSLY